LITIQQCKVDPTRQIGLVLTVGSNSPAVL